MKILKVQNLSRHFGGIKANDNVSFEVDEGTILGVIGPNGAGKSTLFDLITGFTTKITEIFFECSMLKILIKFVKLLIC